MKGEMRMLSKRTRILSVIVMSCIVFMLASMTISVNCEEESIDLFPNSMSIKPDKIILNANSEVNDVIAHFPGVPSCPLGADFVSELTLSKDGVFLDPILANSYHYCIIDDVLQVHFARQEVQDLVGDEAGIYTATVTFEIVDEISLAGKDETVEMIKPGKFSK